MTVVSSAARGPWPLLWLGVVACVPGGPSGSGPEVCVAATDGAPATSATPYGDPWVPPGPPDLGDIRFDVGDDRFDLGGLDLPPPPGVATDEVRMPPAPAPPPGTADPAVDGWSFDPARGLWWREATAGERARHGWSTRTALLVDAELVAALRAESRRLAVHAPAVGGPRAALAPGASPPFVDLDLDLVATHDATVVASVGSAPGGARASRARPSFSFYRSLLRRPPWTETEAEHEAGTETET